MYWCDVCDLEIPAANVIRAEGGLYHRKGAEMGQEFREGEQHPVRQLADTHEVSEPPHLAFPDESL